jgi:alkylhydroperoxidase family enzyme
VSATEARVARLSADEARAVAEQAGIPALMADLSVFQVLLRNAKVAKVLQDMLGALLWQGELDGRLRELVIMRIGWTTGSVYEWTQHWRVATGMGVSADDLVGVRDWEAYAGFGPAERAVLAATDETLATGTISAATWAACEAHVGGPAELIELVVAIGNWRLFSSLLRSLEVPLEDGVAPWPPDGQSPSQQPQN